MNDIIYNLFHPLPNAIMSAIMVVVFIYWIASFLGVGLDDFDLGLGVETDVDVDAGVDVDSDADVSVDTDGAAHDHHNEGLFVKALKFINVGKVPFMIVLSTLKLFTWIGTLLTTQIFPAITDWGWKSVLILLPLFIISIFFTKIATNPIAKFLKNMGYHGEEEIELMGRSGKMLSTVQGEKMGIAEFVIDKNPIKLNVISQNGDEIKYGRKVVIMDETDDKKIFHVTKDYTIE